MGSLSNKIIISTRPLSEEDSIKSYLTAKGALVLDFPMIEIADSELSDDLKANFLEISSFHWLVFTSKNGVKYFFKLLDNLGLNIASLSQIKIAVVGKITAKEVKKFKAVPFLVSSGNTSQDLLNELLAIVKPNEKVFLSLAELADDTLEKGLAGTAVPTRLNAYKTIQPTTYSQEIIDKIRENAYDMILFTSASGVQNFNRLMAEQNINYTFRAACIGTTTEKEMLKFGYIPVLVSSRSNGGTFAQELEQYFENN
jgi:uroporphyrinogen-III synthase